MVVVISEVVVGVLVVVKKETLLILLLTLKLKNIILTKVENIYSIKKNIFKIPNTNRTQGMKVQGHNLVKVAWNFAQRIAGESLSSLSHPTGRKTHLCFHNVEHYL